MDEVWAEFLDTETDEIEMVRMPLMVDDEAEPVAGLWCRGCNRSTGLLLRVVLVHPVEGPRPSRSTVAVCVECGSGDIERPEVLPWAT